MAKFRRRSTAILSSVSSSVDISAFRQDAFKQGLHSTSPGIHQDSIGQLHHPFNFCPMFSRTLLEKFSQIVRIHTSIDRGIYYSCEYIFMNEFRILTYLQLSIIRDLNSVFSVLMTSHNILDRLGIVQFNKPPRKTGFDFAQSTRVERSRNLSQYWAVIST